MKVWLDHDGKLVPQLVEEKIKKYYDQVNGNYQKLLPLLKKEFNWTDQQCYIATDHLYIDSEYLQKGN